MSFASAVGEALRAMTAKPVPQAHQMPPEDPDWRAWVLATGRGGGKSFAAMHWLAQYAMDRPGLRARIIAPTFADGVASCIEGPNGLLRFEPTARFAASAAGGARVEFTNGSYVWVIGTHTPKDVDRLRALTNINVDVFEEAAANPQLKAAVDQAALSRRASDPRWVATTTPRPLKIMKDWQADPRVHYVRAPSSANAHADAEWLAELESMYGGTRLYRQEVEGEILEDVEGALWTQVDLDRSLIEAGTVALTKIVIGVDPPSGPGTCGIVVVGRDAAGHLYVLDDLSVTDATPGQWADVVVKAAKEYDALVVAEINQGGRMVTEVLQSAAQRTGESALPVTTVHASKGKQTRAEPIALMWEATEQTAHLYPVSTLRLAKLVDQLTSWIPNEGDSPDRLDAMVWAATYLRTTTYSAPSVGGVASVAKQLPGW